MVITVIHGFFHDIVKQDFLFKKNIFYNTWSGFWKLCLYIHIYIVEGHVKIEGHMEI